MIHCELFCYHLKYDNELFSFKRNYKFQKGFSSVSISNGLFSLVFKHDLQNCKSEKNNKCFWILSSLHTIELRINYVPEIRDGCNLWEQGAKVSQRGKLFEGDASPLPLPCERKPDSMHNNCQLFHDFNFPDDLKINESS